MRNAIRTLIVFVALLSVVTTAPAEIVRGAWELGAYGGAGVGDDDVENGGMYAVKGAYSLNSILQLELGIEYFDSELQISGAVGPTNEPAQQVDLRDLDVFTDASFLYYALNLTANFRTETDGAKLIPYLSVGFGVAVQDLEAYSTCVPIQELTTGVPARDPNNISTILTCDSFDEEGQLKDPTASYDDEDFAFPSDVDRNDTGTLVSAGVGLRWFATERIGIRGEWRYYHHDTFDLNQDAFSFLFGVTVTLGPPQ